MDESNKSVIVELSEAEAEVLSEYAFRKACRLAESGLTDSRCYPLLMSAYRKITAAVADTKSVVFQQKTDSFLA